MKKFVVVLAAITFACLASAFAPRTSHVCASNALFCDTFSGSSLDLNKWQPNWYGATNKSITKPVNGAERACYDPRQSTVSGGKLKMTLIHASCKADNGTTYPETTGSVSTLHSFSFQDGTLTARVWLAGTANTLFNWAAVWTDGFPTWPHNGESDVMEVLSGNACYHYHSDSGAPGGCVSLGQGWHTFSEDVRNGKTTYSYDGKVVGTVTSVKAKHFIILGNQSGTYGGQDVAATMKVDWIEVQP